MQRLISYLLFIYSLIGCATATTQQQYDQTGKLQAVWRYVDGIKQGKSLLYNLAGEPYFEANYVDGAMQGSSREYTFFDGNKELVVRYECRGNHCKGYTPHGETLLNDITFEQGLPHGSATYYYATGERHTTVTFAHGYRQGQENHYYKNGQLKQTTTYVDGKMDGPQTSYAKNGQIQRRSIIKPRAGLSVHLQTKEYDVHGVLRHETLTNEQGAILFQREYSEIGALFKVRDHKRKITTIYNDQGGIISETTWQK